MAGYSRQRDSMFCQVCRTMMSFNSPGHLKCFNCISPMRIKSISRKKIGYNISAELIISTMFPLQNLRRELGMSSPDDIEEERELNQMDYNAKCKSCHHMGMAYVARQIRSADESQTIFYTCPICAHRQTENS